MTVNRYKVNKRQWKKWSPQAQRIFNNVFEMMYYNTHLFLHPESSIPYKGHWRTTSWNAAWTAADAVMKE